MIKSTRQIEGISRASSLLADCFKVTAKWLKSGVAVEVLEKHIQAFILTQGASPSFGELQNYPFSCTISVNDEICHGLPIGKVLQNGDMVTLDIGLRYKGYCSDMAKSFIIGRGSVSLISFYWKAYRCFTSAWQSLRIGDSIEKLSKILALESKKCGLVVYPEFTGHGIGDFPHEKPKIYHVGVGENFVLENNMVFTIEPVFGSRYFPPRLLDNGFTYVGSQHVFTASFEHTVKMSKNGIEILTQVSR